MKNKIKKEMEVWRLVDQTNKFCLVSFFNGISTFVGYLMQIHLCKKNSNDTI